jgi:hypothetical protein
MSERRLVGSRLQALLGIIDELRPPGTLDLMPADELLGDAPEAPVYIDVEATEPSSERAVVVVVGDSPDDLRRRIMEHAVTLQKGEGVGAVTLPCLLSPAASEMKAMLDAEIAEQDRVRCPRCGGPTLTGYPGGDPENGAAGRRCRDSSCQFERDVEEMETVYVVTSPNDCTGVTMGVDVEVFSNLNDVAVHLTDFTGIDVDPDILTGEDLLVHREESGWTMSPDGFAHAVVFGAGHASRWTQVSRRRVR